MSESEQRQQDANGTFSPRDATGVPALDTILGGGLPRGALTILVGPPGSGKTVLASQIAFAAARRATSRPHVRALGVVGQAGGTPACVQLL